MFKNINLVEPGFLFKLLLSLYYPYLFKFVTYSRLRITGGGGWGGGGLSVLRVTRGLCSENSLVYPMSKNELHVKLLFKKESVRNVGSSQTREGFLCLVI
jgi:hypothetical protein